MKRWWMIPELLALAAVGAILWRVAVPLTAFAGARVEGSHPGPWLRPVKVVEKVPARPTSDYADPAFSLSHADLTRADLSQSGQALRDRAEFDSGTVWPAQLPAGFDPARFMELGRDPGLGVRALHQKGITGKGVNVAFIDQALLVDHQEYKDRIVRYVELGQVDKRGTMHGAAVASIIAGKTVGVAPEANLTYYAAQLFQDPTTLRMQRDFTYYARAINEILDRNRTLPMAERVRAIGASVGPGPVEPGFSELRQAIERARREGVLVAVTNTQEFFGKGFAGMDRPPDADPNDFNSFLPGSFRAKGFYATGQMTPNTAMVPMDSRATAAETGLDHYRFYRQGGESWSVPYVIGLYALVAQVDPQITPEQFLDAAFSSGAYITVTREGKDYRFGPIVNPAILVDRLAAK